MSRFPVCTSCRRLTPPLGSTVCRQCLEAEDNTARADGVWDRFFAAVEAFAEKHGEASLAEAAQDLRYARRDVLS